MDLILAYGAGLLTLINPCVLPMLPIILASALNVDARGPVVLAAGMGVSFVALGVGVTAFGSAIGLDEDRVGQIAAVMMIGFGLILLTPRFGAVFASATSGLAGRASAKLGEVGQTDLRGQFLTGLLLGAVWSPCVGPTLGGAIALAAQGADLLWAGLVMTAFALGVGTLIVGLSLGAREALRARSASLRGLAERSQPIMGGVLMLVGLAILFRLHYRAEAWLLEIMPVWLLDLSVAL